MDEKTYLTERIDDQIQWYDRKSTWNQRRYKQIRFVATGLSLLIPFSTGFLSDSRQWLKLAIGISGILIAILEYLLSMNKYQENWIEYRAAAESLGREKRLFLTKSGKYQNSKTPFQDFVMVAEKIMAQEHGAWMDYITSQPNEPTII